MVVPSAFSLSLGWEDALQGDAEVQGQERLHVQVRLTSADVRDHGRRHCHQATGGPEDFEAPPGCNRKGVAWNNGGGIDRRGIGDVDVCRQFRYRQGVRLLAAALTESVAA